MKGPHVLPRSRALKIEGRKKRADSFQRPSGIGEGLHKLPEVSKLKQIVTALPIVSATAVKTPADRERLPVQDHR